MLEVIGDGELSGFLAARIFWRDVSVPAQGFNRFFLLPHLSHYGAASLELAVKIITPRYGLPWRGFLLGRKITLAGLVVDLWTCSYLKANTGRFILAWDSTITTRF
ncbi:hypothetical protein [Nitrosococcus halophilus]|uniref:hypothetical protein n=1 Tax=Nitrosococcus halophilus TaxID=133539 RepID=UPI00059D944C|nr:hypothetical protein [Nitrosococcus halophilus]